MGDDELKNEEGETSEEEETKTEPDQSEEETTETDEETEEDAETEETEETDESDDKTDDDADKYTQASMDKRYAKFKQTQERFELFKRIGADAYYDIYPDEKPDGYHKPDTKPDGKQGDIDEKIGKMLIEGGPYDGKTLNQVFEENPAYANILQFEYMQGKATKEAEEKKKADDLKTQIQTEIKEFRSGLASSMFGKNFDDLTSDEKSAIYKEHESVATWMKKTGRGGGYLNDAYYLMNKDKELDKAKKSGAASLAKHLSQSTIKSVSSKKSEGSGSGYDKYLDLTSNQMAKEVEGMSDAAYKKFQKEAPASVREKFPVLFD